jgi:predicted ATPase
MRITHLAIHNYKSLRSIALTPVDLNVVVGANGSGKSNLADCFDFIGEIFRHGLELAIARKGGYENIAYRRQRRSKSAMSIELTVEMAESDVRPYWRRRGKSADLRATHAFSFGASGSSIRAEFKVVAETMSFQARVSDTWQQVANLKRNLDGSITFSAPKLVAEGSAEKDLLFEMFAELPEFANFAKRKLTVLPTELLATSFSRYTMVLHAFTQVVSRIRVYQISPTKSREFGVPTPRPELAGNGANLPAVVDLLKKRNPREWRSVLQAMRTIVPGLSDIDVDYTSNRTLGLFFKEEGFGRPWSVGEVSDGTIQTLALLVAIYDPQSKMLFLEEPENSVHPWVIRNIMTACREASKRKQIIITSHSPIVMNLVQPDELWVMWRKDGASNLEPLTLLDPTFPELWQGGELATFEYVDSGVLPKALPPAPDNPDIE